MVVECSSCSDDSSAPNRSSFIPTASIDLRCLISTQSNFIFIVFFLTCMTLLILLSVIILYHGLQRRQQPSAATSHSDIFTYQTIIVNLIGVSGSIVNSYGIFRNDLSTLYWGSLIWFFFWYGETVFHTLTCLEHYLAVVHPITYMKLRNERGTRIRNVSIGCAWLLCFMGMGSIMMDSVFIILNFCVMGLILLLVSFYSLSVLCVLIRPGPGEQGGTRERVDQSKKRAFYTVVVILGALTLRFLGSLVWMIVYASEENRECLILALVIWLTMPSCLVLPLLFLHRAGKLICCYTVTKLP